MCHLDTSIWKPGWKLRVRTTFWPCYTQNCVFTRSELKCRGPLLIGGLNWPVKVYKFILLSPAAKYDSFSQPKLFCTWKLYTGLKVGPLEHIWGRRSAPPAYLPASAYQFQSRSDSLLSCFLSSVAAWSGSSDQLSTYPDMDPRQRIGTSFGSGYFRDWSIVCKICYLLFC